MSRHKKSWPADHVHIGFQTAGGAHPVISMVVSDGPEEGRTVVAEIDVDATLRRLQSMVAQRDGVPA